MVQASIVTAYCIWNAPDVLITILPLVVQSAHIAYSLCSTLTTMQDKIKLEKIHLHDEARNKKRKISPVPERGKKKHNRENHSCKKSSGIPKRKMPVKKREPKRKSNSSSNKQSMCISTRNQKHILHANRQEKHS